MQSTQKKTFNSFHCYFNDYLALVDRAVHLSILLDFDRGLQITTWYLMIPPQWFPKMPTMENFQQLMVQNPAMQWMWNSVFISLVTMFLVCATSSLAGYVLAKKRFYGQRILFAIFIAAMALPKQVVLVPLVRIVNFMGIHDTLGQLSCLWLDGHSVSSSWNNSVKTSQQNCLNQLKSTVVVRFVLSGA